MYRLCPRAAKHVKSYHTQTGVHGDHPRPKKQQFQLPQDVIESRIKQSNFYSLVSSYRQHGHKKANIDPIAITTKSYVNELDLHRYGLKSEDRFNFNGILYNGTNEGSITEAVNFLEKTYCGPLGAEFMHLEEEEEREWFSKKLEQQVSEEVDQDTKRNLARELLKSQAFDNFLASKFVTVKRYGGEGAEAMMGFYTELFRCAVRGGTEQIVMGMAHRGRLNILTGLLQFPPELLFRKLRGLTEFPPEAKATSDVIGHLVSSVDLDYEGTQLHVTVLRNPSHLEAVNPVSLGKTRARQQSLQDAWYSENTEFVTRVLNVQVHGDAAFAGQGVNQETLAMSYVPHFSVGGSLHLIVNNQLGFTTPAPRGRSSRYASGLAHMIHAPVLHVNGDHPEVLVKATRLACEYQKTFHKDVFIDLNCYRQWGHNELDDPTFTNPAVYKIIHSRKSVPDLYAIKLEKEGLLTKEEAAEVSSSHYSWLNEKLKSLDTYEPEKLYLQKHWSEIVQAPAAVTTWDTGVSEDILQHVGVGSVTCPDNFTVHPHLEKTHVQARLKKLAEGKMLDWATAEALAVGSLLYEGYDTRISGQDVGRGTFSHRHLMLVDNKTNDVYIPLNSLSVKQTAYLEIANSILSEEAVLGFEYGMSIESPNRLIIWEAQFGDFFNGAQIHIDTFVTGGETKWMEMTGLVMLLPHGYDGAGPEHSSSRIERFLQMTDSKETSPDGDDVNVHIANPTTPAQYFHLLRKQIVQNYRKPLVIISPKILLRLPEATSAVGDMSPGTSFNPVIGDPTREKAKRVIFVSGKHWYALEKQRAELGDSETAIIRLESLSPFPLLQLQEQMDKYKNARVFVWSQEEPQNMGAWSYVRPRFENLLGKRLKYVGRPALGTPAVGIAQVHQQESLEVLTKSFMIK